MLPMRPGQIERRTHNYIRHGTLSLFALSTPPPARSSANASPAIERASYRTFLNLVEANVPDNLDVHVIMDNISTHKTQAIQNWFAKRPRWHTHYTPTWASWISLVERFFANLTEKQIRRGAHRSTEELEAAIASYINAVNAKPKAFVWTKFPDDILASVKRFCAATLSAAQTQTTIATTSESGH